MSARIIDGKEVATSIRGEVAARVTALRAGGRIPGLAAVLVGEDPASISYVTAKTEACAELGIASETFRLPATASEAEVLELIASLNDDHRFHGILPQLPMPPQVREHAVIDALDPGKDVDGLHPRSLGRLLRGETGGPIPCTPAGVLELLLRTGNNPAGKHAVVVGRSTLVGRPLAILLSNKTAGGNATVTICHTATANLESHTRIADILIIAAGRPRMITAPMVKPGAVVIDIGTNRIEDASRARGWRLVGDCDYAAVREVASWITPVPGGVGPMTIAMLMVNTVNAAEKT